MRRQVNDAVRLASIGARDIKIKTDVDTSQLDGFAKSVSNIDRALSAGGSSGGRSRLGLYTSLGVTAATAVPGVLSLAGSLEKVAGAAILVPSLLAAAGAGVATLVVGFQGIKTALGEKTIKDPKKYAAALADLAPNARATAIQINGLSTQLHALRLSVQQSLFAGMSGEVQRLGAVLIPPVRSGLTGIATQANAAARSFAGFATSAQTVRDLRTTFADIQTAFSKLTPAVAPFMRALRDVGTVGASFLPGLATSVSNVATKFGTFIANARQTGQLRGWIQSGLDAVKQLGSVLGSTLSVLQGFIRAAQNAGGGVLGGLATVLKKVADVVNGPAFQKGLTQFFTGLNAGFTALGSAMPALGSALAALGPPLGALATGVGKVLADAIKAITPAIISMAPALTQLITALTQLTSGTIGFLAPLLTDIAKAAAFVVQNVPGATVAISALILALGAKWTVGAVGLGKSLTSVTTAVKNLVKNSEGLAALKIGFEAKDIATSGAVAGNLGRIGALAGKTGITTAGLTSVLKGLGVAGVVAGGLMYGLQLRLQHLKDAHDSAREASDKLRASFDKGKQSLVEFAATNVNAIKQLRESGNSHAFLVQIGFSLVQNGLTPKEAFAEVQRLAIAAGVKLPIDFTFNTLTDPAAQLQAIADKAKELTAQIRIAGGGVGRFGQQLEGIGVIGTKTQEDLDGIGQSAFDAFKAGNFKGGVDQIAAFEKAVRATNAPLGAQKAAVEEVNQAFLRAFGPSLGISIRNTTDLKSALGELTRSTQAQPIKDYAQSVLDAMNATDKWGTGVGTAAGDVSHLAIVSHVARDAIHDQATQSDIAASATARHKKAVKDLTSALDALQAAILKSIGGDIDLKVAQGNAIDAAIALGQAVKKNGDHFEATTAKGRLNNQAIQALVSSFKDAVTATGDWARAHHETESQVTNDLLTLRKHLVDNAVKAGVSRAEAQKLVDTYLKIPTKVVTDAVFNAKNANAARDAWAKKATTLTAAEKIQAQMAGGELGDNLGHGFQLGLEGRIASVASIAARMTQAAIKASRDTMQSRSPSRVMMGVGKDFVDGFAIGIQNNTKTVVGAATTTATAITVAFKSALGAISASLKTQPTTVGGLADAYQKVRDALVRTLPAYTSSAAAYDLAKAKTVALKDALRVYTQAQTVHNAQVAAGVAGTREYLRIQLDTARAHGASKKVTSDLTEKIRLLSLAQSGSAADARAAAAVIKAALRDQIAAAEAAQAKAKSVSDSAKTAYKDAVTAAKDAARALVDIIQSQADALVQQMADFRSRMVDQISGGALDFAKAWGSSTDSSSGVDVFVPGTVEQLKAALDARLASVKQFATDLQNLAKAGASQDLISEIAGLGPDQGDVLAQQLLASGPDAVQAIADVMKQIQDAAGAGADGLTNSFYKPGVDAITQLIKGMQKQFPELKKALQAIVDLVNSTLAGVSATVTKVGQNLPTTPVVLYHPPIRATGNSTASINNGASNAHVTAVDSAAIVSAVQQGTAATVQAFSSSNQKFLMLKRMGAA